MPRHSRTFKTSRHTFVHIVTLMVTTVIATMVTDTQTIHSKSIIFTR